jgi:hypothetical protein
MNALKTKIYIAWTGVEMTLSWANERDYDSAMEFFAELGVLCVPSLPDQDLPLFVCLEKEQQLDALYEFRRKLRDG